MVGKKGEELTDEKMFGGFFSEIGADFPTCVSTHFGGARWNIEIIEAQLLCN